MELALRKVWSFILELARFVWETREAFRRPGEAPQGRALKTREDEKKREFLGRAARQGGPMADRNHGGSLGGGKGGGKPPPPQKCVVTLFAARGPEEPGGALRRGALGPF